MSDDKKNVGNPDRSRISTNERYEMDYWSKKFGITHDELKAAIQVVGNNPKDVETYLNTNS
jgi:hypothetical protein